MRFPVWSKFKIVCIKKDVIESETAISYLSLTNIFENYLIHPEEEILNILVLSSWLPRFNWEVHLSFMNRGF